MGFPQEIEQLVFRGFITEKLKISDIDFVFKTLNDDENDLINQYCSNDHEKTFYVFAFSVFLFEKENVLKSPRLEQIDMLVKFFKNLPSPVLNQIAEVISRLGKKSVDALGDVRRFAYDDLSRMRWHSVKLIPINSTQYTGIEGTELLGLNLHQQLWCAFNQAEDTREQIEISWEMTKAILRSNLTKQSANKLESSDRRRKKEEEEKRESIKAGKQPEQASRDTKENLVAELDKALQGKKDEHDNFIDAYEKQLKERALKKQLEVEALRKSSRKGFDVADVFSETRVATKHDLEKLIPRRPISSNEQPSVSEKLAQEMAQLDPERTKAITEEVSKSLTKSELFKEEEDKFFESGGSSGFSDDQLNKQLLNVKPGTPEYKELVAKLKKKSILKLK